MPDTEAARDAIIRAADRHATHLQSGTRCGESCQLEFVFTLDALQAAAQRDGYVRALEAVGCLYLCQLWSRSPVDNDAHRCADCDDCAERPCKVCKLLAEARGGVRPSRSKGPVPENTIEQIATTAYDETREAT